MIKQEAAQEKDLKNKHDIANKDELYAKYDIANADNDFPILQQEIYSGKKLVYLDSGASTQQCEMCLQAVEKYNRCYHSNVHRGVHCLSQKATDLYESARDTVQKFINAETREQIIFTRGTTAAINLVAQSYAGGNLSAGDEIIITAMEHHANIVPWQMIAKKTGAIIKVIPLRENCDLDLTAFDKLLSDRTALVAITHVSNAIGTVNPIKTIINKSKKYAAKVLIDGAQAVARMAVDVQDLDCDFYAFSGHKLYGPTGIGVLYAKKDCLDKMLPVEGGGDMIRTVSFTESTYAPAPYCFEAGTPPIAAAVGLGAAIKYINELGLDNIYKHEQQLISYALDELNQLANIKVIGAPAHRASVISWVHENVHPHDVGTIVDRDGVALRVGHHCAMPLMSVLKVAATVRASFAVYNNKSDIDALILSLKKVGDIFS
jgi:cysteine desulfurase / selenocysteine lyase